MVREKLKTGEFKKQTNKQRKKKQIEKASFGKHLRKQ